VPLFSELINETYMPFIKGYKRSWKNEVSYFRQDILPAFGHRYLDEITQQQIISFHHNMLATGYAPATCNRCLISLRHIFNRCLDWNIVGFKENPTKGVKLFEENNLRERYITEKELSKLYQSAVQSKKKEIWFIIGMLILTGARKREVLDAQWSEFDFDRKQWRIPMAKSGKARHVPISNPLAELLKSIPRSPGCAFVVPDPKTLKPFTSIHYYWDEVRTNAALPTSEFMICGIHLRAFS
jgi:integrase